ncbi:MAG: hypothetical protein VX438_14105 [Planctomycetota bacterium]|nr:hypothetical protein [Planctomycetota bacterium]
MLIQTTQKLFLLAMLAGLTTLQVACNNTNTAQPNTAQPNTAPTETTKSETTKSETTKSTTTDAAQDQNIIDAHIAAVGGSTAIKKIKTITKSWAVSTTAPTGNGNGTSNEMFDLVAERGRIDLDLGVYKESKGWSGQKGWKQSTFETLRDLTADELGLDKIAGPISLIFTIKDIFGSVAFLPPTKAKFNGQDCVKVKIVESPLELYVNGKTKLLEGIEVPSLMKLTFSNYQESNGVQVAHNTKVEITALNTTVLSELKKFTVNEKLDEVKFSKPANKNAAPKGDF